jgi:hypothetical protein
LGTTRRNAPRPARSPFARVAAAIAAVVALSDLPPSSSADDVVLALLKVVGVYTGMNGLLWLAAAVFLFFYLGSDEAKPVLAGLTDDQRDVARLLVAAVAGAALAFLFNFALKRRDEARELRAVTRLIDHELAQAAAALDPEGRFRKVWDVPTLRETPLPRDTDADEVARAGGLEAWQAQRRMERLRVAAWNEHKLLLARQLSFPQWDTLRSAYAAIEYAKESGVPIKAGATLAAVEEARTVARLRAIDRARAACWRHIRSKDDIHELMDEAEEAAIERDHRWRVEQEATRTDEEKQKRP